VTPDLMVNSTYLRRYNGKRQTMLKRALISVLGSLICCCSVRAQLSYPSELPPLLAAYRSSGQDTNRVAAALALAFYYKAKSGEAKSDMDSAFFWTDDAEAVARKLNFAAGVERSVFMRNFIRIEAHQRPAVERSLGGLSDTNRIKTLLEISIWDFFNHRDTSIDVVRVRLRECLRQSDSLHNPRMQAFTRAALGMYYAEKRDTATGQQYFAAAIHFMDSSGAWPEEARACWLYATISNVDGSSAAAAYYMDRAAVLSGKSGDKYSARYLFDLASNVQFNNGDMGLALADAKAALDLAQQFKDETAIDNIYSSICKYAYYEGDYRQGLAYSLEHLKVMRAADDKASGGAMYSFLGDIYWLMGMKEAGLAAYSNSIRINKKLKYPQQEAAVAVKYTWAMIAEGRAEEGLAILQDIGARLPSDQNVGQVFLNDGYGNCYNALGQYAKAEQSYMTAWAYDVKTNNFFLCTCCYYLSVFYAGRKQPEKAIHYAKMAVEAVHKPMPAWMKKDLYYLLYREDSVMGDYRSAVGYYQQYADLNDSLLVMTSRQVERLEHQVETDRKDQELLAKDSQIRREAIIRNFIVAGIGLLAIILVLVFNQYRLKRKANAIIGHHNLLLQQHLVEKENMMTEIHHRVKNNLQTVVSLLESQSAYLQDDALSAIKDSQNRVHAMSLIHQKLYLSEGQLTRIELSSYMRELVAYLQDAFDTGNRIRFHLDLSEVWLDVSQAVPIGLITNEVVTNSMKHAFSGWPGGGGAAGASIHVRMGERFPGVFFLEISDNGKGLPPDLDLARAGSLGLRLIRGLADSLNGSLRVSGERGTVVGVEFKVG
jgi:two-component system, sensor histidine kinase PdtaS